MYVEVGTRKLRVLPRQLPSMFEKESSLKASKSLCLQYGPSKSSVLYCWLFQRGSMLKLRKPTASCSPFLCQSFTPIACY